MSAAVPGGSEHRHARRRLLAGPIAKAWPEVPRNPPPPKPPLKVCLHSTPIPMAPVRGRGTRLREASSIMGSRFPELANISSLTIPRAICGASCAARTSRPWSLASRERVPITALHADPTNGDVLATDYGRRPNRSGSSPASLVPGFAGRSSGIRASSRAEQTLSRFVGVALRGKSSRLERSCAFTPLVRHAGSHQPHRRHPGRHLELPRWHDLGAASGFETERGNPKTARPFETRLLVKI